MEEAIKPGLTATSPVSKPSGVVVQTGTATAAAAPDSKVTKVIVAVHGVGDQHNYATIQSVVNQFCNFYREPTAVPLGSFYTGGAAYSLQPPYSAQQFEHLAFAEVYWATIPRAAANAKYTLEEAKKWATTIVERLRLRWRQTGSHGDSSEADFVRLKHVLAEMIETIAVLERLCYLAERAGLFSFDLRKLLDDYLGDVQVVAEFGSERRKILDTFADLMKKVHDAYPAAEIFLVAHSEGTVVSFLGLLEAIREPQAPGWLARVRGLMTFGSPIDKHLILWPELFKSDLPGGPTWRPSEPIEWRNYYDRGDPIGFELSQVRAWLKANAWDGVFHFEKDHDIGFTRYAYPGKAHVDYWDDEEVFGHFIQTVVNKPPKGAPPTSTPGSGRLASAAPADAESAKPARSFETPPGDIPAKKWLSYVLPYVGVVALLVVAAYILFKAFIGCIDPKELIYNSNPVILRNVAALAILLFGVTVTARIPRLTRLWYWRLTAWIAYLLSAAAYMWIVPSGGPSGTALKEWLEHNLNVAIAPGGTRLILATLVVGLAYWLSTKKPSWGLKPLIVLGTGAVAVIVGQSLYLASDRGPVWPVFLATAGFFYLWWLAALIFDLVFVWHVYIRQSMALERMDKMVGSGVPAIPTSSTGVARAGQGQR